MSASRSRGKVRRGLALVLGVAVASAVSTVPHVASAQARDDAAVQKLIEARRKALLDAARAQRSDATRSVVPPAEGAIDYSCPADTTRFVGDGVAYNPPPRRTTDGIGCRVQLISTSGFWDAAGAEGGGGAVLRGRILRTTDQGLTWVAADAGLPEPRFVDGQGGARRPAEWPVVSELSVYAPDPNIVYVGTRLVQAFPVEPRVANGIFKSVDGGMHWTSVNHGLPRRDGSTDTVWDTSMLLVHPNDPDRVLVTVADVGNLPIRHKAFRSTDGGERWDGVTFGDVRDDDILRVLIFTSSGSETVRASLQLADGSSRSLESADFGSTWRQTVQ